MARASCRIKPESLKRGLAVSLSVIFALIVLICGLIVHPEALFPHVMTGQILQVYSDQPIDEQGGHDFICDTEKILTKWPYGFRQRQYRVFVTNSTWRRLLFFTLNFDSGGVVYCFLSERNAFLSGADFRRGRLIAPTGMAMPPPRTLAFYGAHELVHLLTAERVGVYRFVTMPAWISEGVADYIALGGTPDLAALERSVNLAQDSTSIELINRFGVYPKYRLLVAKFSDVYGWSLDRLFQCKLGFDSARVYIETRIH